MCKTAKSNYMDICECQKCGNQYFPKTVLCSDCLRNNAIDLQTAWNTIFANTDVINAIIPPAERRWVMENLKRGLM